MVKTTMYQQWEQCKVKGVKRNPAGGLMAPTPGGYERQWSRIIGVGLWKGIDSQGRPRFMQFRSGIPS